MKKDKKRDLMIKELRDISFKYKEYFCWDFILSEKSITIEIKNKEKIWDKHLPNLADKKRKQLTCNKREYYTKKEFEKQRKKILKKKLP